MWRYMGPGPDTQTSGASAAPNELEQHAQMHNIAAPELPTPPTPRSTDYEDGQHSPMIAAATPAALYCDSYPIQTRLTDGRPSIIIDPGSVGNLCGDEWAREVAEIAHENGHRPRHEKRSRPLEVSGVGNGSQKCLYDCNLPVAFKSDSSNQQSVIGNLTSPAVVNSKLPGLLGLTALRKNRAVLDFTTLKLYFCGPADYDVAGSLPEGSDAFQLEIAPSGHIVLPCCEFKAGSTSNQHSLTLLARDRSNSSNSSSSNSSSSLGTQH